MMISFFSPVVSGSCAILAGSFPAITAAACRTSPPAEPLDTNAASAPTISAMISPALAFSSWTSTSTLAALFIASITSRRSFVPP